MSWGVASERHFDLSNTNTPKKLGPGYYETDIPFGNTKVNKVPFLKRGDLYDKKPESTPDPGQYEAKPLYGPPGTKSVFESKSKRKIYYTTDKNPDPAAYGHLKDWIPEAPKPGHKKPTPDAIPLTGFVGQDVDGYIIDENGTLVPVKKQFHDHSWVGPGSYEASKLSKSAPISLDKSCTRDLYGSPPDVPGPGAYSYFEYSSRINHQIRPKPTEKPPEFTSPALLGPEKWTENRPETSADFKSRSTRGIFLQGDPTPDPGQYDPHSVRGTHASSFASTAAFGFRSDRTDFWEKSDTPGPGTYEAKRVTWVKKGSALGRRAVDRPEKSAGYPGPGAYDVAVAQRERRPNSVFVTQTRRDLRDLPADNPGPGAYSPDKPGTSAGAARLNATNRFRKHGEWQQTNDNPAPGQYDAAAERGMAKTISRIGHRPLYERTKNPGPGTYEVTHGTMLRHSYNTTVPI